MARSTRGSVAPVLPRRYGRRLSRWSTSRPGPTVRSGSSIRPSTSSAPNWIIPPTFRISRPAITNGSPAQPNSPPSPATTFARGGGHPRAKVVAGDGGELGWAGEPFVIAGRDILKVGGIIQFGADEVDGRIDEPDRTVGPGLLVDQRDKRRP